MDIPKLNYTLSQINNVLGSTIGAVEDRQQGADTGTSIMNFGLNVLNGAVRNEVAYDMRRTTGSNLGFLINNMAGYGSEEANIKGMNGLLGASVFNAVTSPWWRLLCSTADANGRLLRNGHVRRRIYGRSDICKSGSTRRSIWRGCNAIYFSNALFWFRL